MKINPCRTGFVYFRSDEKQSRISWCKNLCCCEISRTGRACGRASSRASSRASDFRGNWLWEWLRFCGFRDCCSRHSGRSRVIQWTKCVFNSFPLTSLVFKPWKEITRMKILHQNHLQAYSKWLSEDFGPRKHPHKRHFYIILSIASLPVSITITNVFCGATIFDTFHVRFSFFIIQCAFKLRTKHRWITPIVNDIWRNCLCGNVNF